MLKHLSLLVVAASLSMGVTCTITGPDGGGTTTQTPLDQATADIAVAQTVGVNTAAVSATIVDRFGRTIVLSRERNVTVNSVSLDGPSSGVYTASIPAASQYVITVREPTRGVETTTVEAPATFTITSPAAGGTASLSSFTLVWSAADPSLSATITLRQTFAGTTETESFGPVVDAGLYVFTAADLRDFVQGVDLEISITKTNTLNDLAGFDSSTVTVEATTARTTSPRS